MGTVAGSGAAAGGGDVTFEDCVFPGCSAQPAEPAGLFCPTHAGQVPAATVEQLELAVQTADLGLWRTALASLK